MAFETFLTLDKQKPKKGRRIMFAVSLTVHGVLLAVGVAASYASVEELTAKNGTLVTFHTPPTPPAPPLGGGTKPKPRPKARPDRVQPRLNALVAPKDTEAPDAPEGPGVPHGKPGGVTDGTGDYVTPDPPPPTYLPPNVARGQLAIDPRADQHRVKLPPAVMRAGMSIWALLRICADRDGNVVEAKIIKGVDSTIDASFIAAVRTWRYTPFKVDGRPVPFCTNVRYEVQTTN